MSQVSNENIYQLEGKVPLKTALPLGIQHLLAMFLGNISPLIIVCGMLQMDLNLKTALIQNAMFIAGVTTLIQIYPIMKIGSGLPGVMGTSSGFLGTAKAIGVTYGYGAIMGASVVGALFEMVLGYFIKPLKKLFPPIVTSLVVISIGLSLLPVGIRYFGGGFTPEFGDPKHIIVGTVVVIMIIILNQCKQKFISASAILISIVIGYILAIVMGMVDFTAVKETAWFSLPKVMPVGIEFNINAIIAMLIMYVATAVETVGDLSGIANGGLDREPTDEELSGGVIADGFGSLIAAFFGVLPNTTFSQNVGLVAVTKVVNRFVIGTGAIVLVLMGFIPKLSAIFTVMPQSVLGGAAVVMFAMIFVSGLKSLLRDEIDDRKGLIIAISLGLGVGIGNLPDVLAHLPKWVGQIFAQNGIIMTFVIATTLNLILPEKKKEK
ncbi:MAG: purine permease [Fusobacterium perfoetens]|uniref:uracil-xanthine permease family protein n=1 Tax=Fusobacterium perfoetens TaxID=852 RepID=UPI0023EF7337|nr:nucleobase:cation symporter-2 family protein [Fusobacterium perfoetens]MCI6152612.1 purine permease [Fusobacterium perfoetens]MDY3237619.1 nucleobase:cation symporter-2 family protein [Fusobacterium perfoetens]